MKCGCDELLVWWSSDRRHDQRLLTVAVNRTAFIMTAEQQAWRFAMLQTSRFILMFLDQLSTKRCVGLQLRQAAQWNRQNWPPWADEDASKSFL